jgi:TetR/AcrR family transcriptional repressor of nem operon
LDYGYNPNFVNHRDIQIVRKSKAEAAETRRQIIDIAAQEFRLNGIHATGVATLMSKAGLTNGGFYKHFESKDQLVAEACSTGMATVVDAFKAVAVEHSGKESFKAIVERYVSMVHRDNAIGGCPLAGMGSELARADEHTRAAASQGFNDLIDIIATHIGGRSQDAARSEAVFAFAAMIGAVTMSRIIVDPDTSASVLQDVTQHLNAM